MPSQPLAVAMRTLNFTKSFSMFATLVSASGGSAPSRYMSSFPCRAVTRALAPGAMRLRTFPMKAALLILFTASALIAAEPDGKEEETLYRTKFEPQEIELDGYSFSASPWKDNKDNSAFERHLVSLMRVEVRLWGLQEYLRTGARGWARRLRSTAMPLMPPGMQPRLFTPRFWMPPTRR